MFGAITSVGRCSRSMSQAVVADFPVPVAPSSTTSRSPAMDAALQLVDGRRLVAGGSVRADDLEVAADAHDLVDRAVFRVRDYRMFGGESHATRVEACTDKCPGAVVLPYPTGRVQVRVTGSHCSR